MTDLKQQTVDTYNRSAKELAEYFRGIGSRTKDIDLAIKLAENPKNPKILEIGCGDGRDAKKILERTNNYTGFDISEELIKLARQYVPNGKFEVADATAYQYPSNLDIVFAFASLLHLEKDEVKDVLQKVLKSLIPGGIFYISLKYSTEYTEKLKEDKFGGRMFYFYNPKIIKELAGKKYEVSYLTDIYTRTGDTKWFEIALRKI